MPSVTVPRLSKNDPSSFSNSHEIQIKHISCYWDLDFARHVMSGCVVLNCSNQGAKELILDTKDLNIKSVVDVSTGKESKFDLGAPVSSFGSPLTIPLNPTDSTVVFRIEYETSPQATAIQWLTPEQTAGGKHPYLFCQCQATYARTMFPCQDTPCIKFTYAAEVTAPADLVVLLSAIRQEEPTTVEGNKKLHKFQQKVAIPSYLLAMACGALESRRIGPRSQVWSEKEYVDAAAYEFTETESMLKIAEDLLGPYVWGVYDILVLPPSFPFGGMENPCLTFVTPTLLAGDRSLATVIGHEITHSWTGNLVTTKNWEHFWLNEGFTTFIERKIYGKLMRGEAHRQLHHAEGLEGIVDEVAVRGENDPLTCLVPDLTGVDPEDAFGRIPYEKGSNFLFYLETLVGGPEVFDKFLRTYIDHFKHQCIETNDFKDYFLNYFNEKVSGEVLNQINWEAWLYKPGFLPIQNKYDLSLADVCKSMVKQWTASSPPNQYNPLGGLSTLQKQQFLSLMLLEKPLSVDKLEKMNSEYGMDKIQNNEVKFRWLRLCLRAKWQPAISKAIEFLNQSGRMKFVRPLYRVMPKPLTQKIVSPRPVTHKSGSLTKIPTGYLTRSIDSHARANINNSANEKGEKLAEGDGPLKRKEVAASTTCVPGKLQENLTALQQAASARNFDIKAADDSMGDSAFKKSPLSTRLSDQKASTDPDFNKDAPRQRGELLLGSPGTGPLERNAVVAPAGISQMARKQALPRIQPTRLFIDREGSKELKAKVMKQASGFGFGLVRSMYHYCITGEFLKMLYAQDQLTDVTISIGNVYFNVHRIVLVCHSEYFENVFLRKHEGGSVIPSEIELSNISEDAFQSILEFMYTGETAINLQNIVEIISAARHLKIHELDRNCEDVLNNITPENALIVLDIAQRFNMQTILEKAYRCITEYFYEVITTESFLKLDLNRVVALLSDDNIQISSEIDVFRAAVRWIGYDRENRKELSERLMACVRFPLMSQEELIACVDEANDIMQKEGCIQMLYYANWYHTCIRLGRGGRYEMKGPHPRSRVPNRGEQKNFENPEWDKAFEARGAPSMEGTEDFAAAMKARGMGPMLPPGAANATTPRAGGHRRTSSGAADGGGGGSKTYLATGVQPVTTRSPSPAPMSMEKLQLTSPTILIVGGFNMQKGDKKIPMRAVDIYLPKPNNWERLSKLPERRTHHAAAFHGASLYITGGFNGRNVTDTVFKYDLVTNQWSNLTPMLTRRMCHQLCILDNHLFAVGGQDDSQQLLNTIERYSFEADQWQYAKPMRAGKLGSSVAAHRGLLWVVGGYDDDSSDAAATAGMPVLKSVECYNPDTNTWSQMNGLRFPRCMANLVEANGKLYLLGGATKCQASAQPTVVSIAAVDIYDDDNDEWYEASQLETPRYNAGCTVIGHRIFIAGGMNSMENQSLCSVECYDVKKDMWLKGVKDIPKVALGLSCVAVPPLKELCSQVTGN